MFGSDVQHDRTKHMVIDQHIKEKMDIINASYIPSRLQLEYLFTKELLTKSLHGLAFKV